LISRLSVPLCLLCIACGDGSEPPGIGGDGSCETVDLPVRGDRDAPLITDVALEVQMDEGIVVLVTASDPQGSENLQDVPQIVRVFQDAGCVGSPIVLQDDLAYSGVEESFGVAVPASDGALFSAISAAESWPVELDFRDSDDNSTSAQVLARVLR
jgi:hypothetical protein